MRGSSTRLVNASKDTQQVHVPAGVRLLRVGEVGGEPNLESDQL